uniref:Cytochrome P450 n=1 Tax=Kalanchoe fedtschenkoi TaxID=63787 RepID=A0A7N0ZXS8_KALFE
MDYLTFILSLLFIANLLYVAKTIKLGFSNLPPGPRPLPIIGNLHQLGPKPHKSLANLARTHGPIMRLELGQVTTVVISSASAARLVLQKQDHSLANRFPPDSSSSCGHDRHSVVWKNLSQKWRELRRICNAEIFSSQKMEAYGYLRVKRVEELVAEIRRSAEVGEPVLIGEVSFKTLLNLLSRMILSVDLDDGGSEAASREFKASFRAMMDLLGMPNLVDYFPWLRVIDPQRIRARLVVHFEKMLGFFDDLVAQRLAQRSAQGPVSEHKDVLDTLVNIMVQSNGEFTRTDIGHLLLDLIVAGTDTTSSTIEWAMTELLKSPETMSKAKAELEQVATKGKPISESDVPRLPYLHAIVKETLRLHPAAPLLIPRKTLDSVDLNGFTIPKGTQIVVNAWAVQRDPATWEDPERFKPERFLNSDVDFRGGSFELIPFGGGRRICPGLPLASKMMPLILGSLLNAFDWRLEEGLRIEDIDMDDKFGLTLVKTRPLRLIPVVELF